MGELGYSLSLYQDSMGYIISPRNRSQETTKVLRKSVCIPWLYSVSLSGDSILIDIMINQIKAPFVPLKGNLPIIRNFLERQNLIFFFSRWYHAFIYCYRKCFKGMHCCQSQNQLQVKKKYHSHIISVCVYIYLYGYIFLSRTNDKKE